MYNIIPFMFYSFFATTNKVFDFTIYYLTNNIS